MFHLGGSLLLDPHWAPQCRRVSRPTPEAPQTAKPIGFKERVIPHVFLGYWAQLVAQIKAGQDAHWKSCKTQVLVARERLDGMQIVGSPPRADRPHSRHVNCAFKQTLPLGSDRNA